MPSRLPAGLALCLCLSFSAQGAAKPDNARLQRLASDPYWINLGHYETGKLGGWRSYVDDPAFFLARNGSTDPAAELQATLIAIQAPANLGDQHAQCKYPARTRWLREQLQLPDLPAPDCREYKVWFADINPHSTVLIYPAAYLGSPSSMFGHTLLRIDQADALSNNTAMLSYALNFGAFIEGDDNSMLYAWRGLMGGYPGVFALMPYRDKMKEYSRLENRDLWEYQLNLTPEETGRMVEHVWELRQIQFDYYFFDENCSYRLLELLEVARPGVELTDDFPITAIPTDTVRSIKQAGMIEEIEFRPSRERELLARAKPLSEPEQELALGISEGQLQPDDSALQALPAGKQAEVQDAAYRLLRYNAENEDRNEAVADRSYALLRAMNKNPPPPLDIPRPELAEEGHPSRTWQLGAGSRDNDAFAEYGLRMAYHDLYDNLAGFPLGAQIEIAQLKLRQYQNNDWKLQQLDIATIRSLTARSELLKPISWQVNGGFQRVPGKNQNDVLVSQVNGGGGGSWALGEQGLLFALATARMEHNNEFAQFVAPAGGFNSGILWRNPLGTMSLEGSGDYFLNGEVRRSLSLNQQWEISRNLGLRLSAERAFAQQSSPVNEVMLELKWYHY